MAARALTLIDTVISNGPLPLGAAAEQTEMAPSTALRHLRALVAAGQYVGGPTSLRVALRLLGDSPFARLTEAAQPHPDTLVGASQESAYLAVRDGGEAIYVAISESPRAIRHAGWVGRSVPVDGTAVGASLLATQQAGEVPVSVNVGALEEDVAGVTVPVFGDDGAVAALSVLGPADRFDELARSRAAAVLQRESELLSSTLLLGLTN